MIERIEKLREALGLKQHELETRAELSRHRVSTWANGTGEPTARQALRIARVLGVPLEWLADEDAPADPPVSLDAVRPGEELVMAAVRKIGVKAAIERLVDAPPRTPLIKTSEWTDETTGRPPVSPTPPSKRRKRSG